MLFNSQVSRNVLDIDQHRILPHAQVVTIHQVLHKQLIKRLDESVELVNDDLQLSDVHVGEHLSREAPLRRSNFHADFVEGLVNQFGYRTHSLLLTLNLDL